MTIPFETINWFAILGAFAANMAIGAIWYGPKVMGDRWLRSTGRTQEDIRDDGQSAMAFVTLPAMANALGLGVLAAALGIMSTLGGLTLGLLVWACFVLPTNVIEILFDRKTVETAIINNGNFLLSFAAMGAIIGTW